MKGRFYLDEGKVKSPPVPFTTYVKTNGKGKLWMNGLEKKLRDVMIDDAGIQGDIDKKSFSLTLEHQPDTLFKAQFKESYYEAGEPETRVYAKNIEGFWSSYRDTGENFGEIYIHKLYNLVRPNKLNLEMDLYYPKIPPVEGERRPLLLLFHSGSFYNGDKKETGFPQMGRYFAERGYVVASINHRLGFLPTLAQFERAGYRALQDAHAAVCYLIDKANEFSIDTTLIFAGGTSAGAITALNLAFMREENRPVATKENGIIEWYKSSPLSELVKNSKYKWLDISIRWYANLVSPNLGKINAVSGQNDRPFQIKAVINMWGAVHTLEMLKNSRQTSILSFHSDTDSIVPHGHGYPFKGVFDPYVDEIINKCPWGIKHFAGITRDLITEGNPLNELLSNPMDGSLQIHNKATSLGMRSELHLEKGGKHSLHLDRFDTLSDYFNDTILPATSRFLYEEIVGGKSIRFAQDEAWIEALNTDQTSEFYWLVEGGTILNRQKKDKIKVMLFEDAPRHAVIATGKYKNGVEFRELLSGADLY